MGLVEIVFIVWIKYERASRQKNFGQCRNLGSLTTSPSEAPLAAFARSSSQKGHHPKGAVSVPSHTTNSWGYSLLSPESMLFRDCARKSGPCGAAGMKFPCKCGEVNLPYTTGG